MDACETLSSKGEQKKLKKRKIPNSEEPTENDGTKLRQYACLGIQCKVSLDSWREARNHMDRCVLMKGEKYKARLKESANKAIGLLSEESMTKAQELLTSNSAVAPLKKKRENSNTSTNILKDDCVDGLVKSSLLIDSKRPINEAAIIEAVKDYYDSHSEEKEYGHTKHVLKYIGQVHGVKKKFSKYGFGTFSDFLMKHGFLVQE